MYNLHLTAEQLEFRDTLHEFAEKEVRPVALHPDRLQPFEKPLLTELLDRASEMGLRTLGLSEEAGGAGADTLTACMVFEELAAGDVDIAAALGQTALIARELFGSRMADAAREQLSKFVSDDKCHLAIAGATRNAAVVRMTDDLWMLRSSSPDCAILHSKARAARVKPIVEEHRAIVDALRTRDPAEARTAMRAHLRSVLDQLLFATEEQAIEVARQEAAFARARYERSGSL